MSQPINDARVGEQPRLTRLTLQVTEALSARQIAEHLADHATEPALATSLFEEDGGRRWRVDAYYSTLPGPLALMTAVAGHEILSGPDIEAVPDENWVTVSQRALPPVAAGRFLVHGSHDLQHVGRRHWALQIDAGEAFGTAHHATTEGCLEMLDRLGRLTLSRRVLDLGCGSGVLAIAASRLWPSARIVASDIDPVAVTVATANARLNRAANRIHMATAPGLDHTALRHNGPYDLIVANILAGPLSRLAPSLARHIAPAGNIVLSGILAPQAREVLAKYRAVGFRCKSRRTIAGWTTLLLTRNQTRPCSLSPRRR